MKALLFPLCFLAVHAFGDGLGDNVSDQVRRIPPPGVPIPEEARARLRERVDGLGKELDVLRTSKALAAERIADVAVFHKAVDWALRYDEFHDAKQVEWAERQWEEGAKRLASLRRSEFPWLEQTGLIPRGYLSQIDGSVQPYGLVVPASFSPKSPHRWRLDVWFHGRGEKLTELDFLHQRMTSPGEFAPPDAIVLHTYGRYCNGQRFAGEVDFFEALADVQKDYRIDEDRILVRGFSLGGAACWHVAARHAWRWCAAAPGAGFSETEQFLTSFQQERLAPSPWERKLWNLYDATAHAGNFMGCPVVAYSGEVDKQRQAAEIMAKALEKEGIVLTHVIGPNTAHKYEPAAKAEINRRMDELARRGRNPRPNAARWTTYSLAANRFALGAIDGLQKHWEPSTIQVNAASSAGVDVSCEGVTAFTLDVRDGQERFGAMPAARVKVGASEFPVRGMLHSDGGLRASFHLEGDAWKLGPIPGPGPRKRPGLQGPIDDAFMSRFIFVRPTGRSANPKVDAWAKAELERAIEHWRRHFRGDATVRDDAAVSAEEIATANLALWGDPSSNVLLAKIADKLPISWSAERIQVRDQSFPAADHALIAIYPNPLNPERYVVLNSGFTFREYDYLNNARQTPKLPDWAVVDLNTPPNPRWPGRIAAADFFGERWELP